MIIGLVIASEKKQVQWLVLNTILLPFASMYLGSYMVKYYGLNQAEWVLATLVLVISTSVFSLVGFNLANARKCGQINLLKTILSSINKYIYSLICISVVQALFIAIVITISWTSGFKDEFGELTFINLVMFAAFTVLLSIFIAQLASIISLLIPRYHLAASILSIVSVALPLLSFGVLEIRDSSMLIQLISNFLAFIHYINLVKSILYGGILEVFDIISLLLSTLVTSLIQIWVVKKCEHL